MHRFLALVLLLISLQAHAEFLNMDGMIFTAGTWGDQTFRKGANASARWDWGVEWLPKSPIQLTGYWQAGVGYWSSAASSKHYPTHTTIVSASPVLQMWVGEVNLKRSALFFELGIGPAYSTETALGKKDLGSHWHFEDKFGVGINLGTERPAQFIFRYMHYSNAGAVMPNHGLDLYTYSMVFFF